MSDSDDLKQKDDTYWREKLTPEQYNVLREKGTEAPFSNKFYKNFDTGMYHCAGCGQELFSSETKFDSDCGWPSFDKSLSRENIEVKDDYSFGMHRVEVLCKKCGGHLGHLFEDGPTETGLRFCINSSALSFKPQK